MLGFNREEGQVEAGGCSGEPGGEHPGLFNEHPRSGRIGPGGAGIPPSCSPLREQTPLAVSSGSNKLASGS